MKQTDVTKNNEILIKLNDALIAIDKQLYESGLCPPIKSIDLSLFKTQHEFRVFVFDISSENDRKTLESLLDDIMNGWWSGIYQYDLKYDTEKNSWKVFLIIYRIYAKFEQTL